MANKHKQKLYKGTHSQMCAALILAWSNYLDHLADFETQNTRYTQQLATQQVAAVKAAQQIPQVMQRRAVPKQARQTLHQTAMAFAAQWQILCSLIEEAFPEEQWDINKSVAGSTCYRKATHRQWQSVFDLITAATDFISQHTSTLLAGGMLPTFPQQVTTAGNAFVKLYNSFYNIKQSARTETAEFIKAGNAVYKTAGSMMRTARRMYNNNPDLCSKFTYASLITIVRGKGFTKSGCRFILKDSATGGSVHNASITITAPGFNHEESFGSRSSVCIHLPAGNYHFTLAAPGFTTIIGNITVSGGTTHQKTLRLTQNKSVTTGEESVAM